MPHQSDDELLAAVYQRVRGRRVTRNSALTALVVLVAATGALLRATPEGSRVAAVADTGQPAATTVSTTTTAPSTTTSAPTTTTTTVATAPVVSPPTTLAPAADCRWSDAWYPTTEPPAGLTVTAAVSTAAATRGRPVEITITVKNTTAEAITHTRDQHPVADFRVEAADGRVVWWSNYRTGYPARSVTETFAPGEEKTTRVTWAQDVCNPDPDAPAPFMAGPPPPGPYRVHASWGNSPGGAWRAEPVALVIR